MATITDISRACGLARTTIAEILRNKPGYNEQTRQRVLRTAQKLGYRPNYLSKALSGGRSMSIGIIVPSLETQLFNERLHALEAAASAAGYLCFISGFGSNVERSIFDLLDRRVDGLVLQVGEELATQIAQRMQGCATPTVWLDAAPADATAVVRVQRKPAIEDLARHLAQQGYRSAAFVASPYHLQYRERRTTHLEQSFKRCGIAWADETCWMMSPVAYGMHSVRRFVAQRLREGAALPEVLLATNDDCALGILAALREAKLTTPTQVGVVGFDDAPMASLVQPSLTTIRQPRGEMGQAVFGLLDQVMNRPDEPVTPVEYTCEFIARESTLRQPH